MSGLAKIRAHLSVGASVEAWCGICHALELEKADVSERGMLLGYVAEHTKDWEARLCSPLYGWWERHRGGETTGYEGIVRDWSGYVWEEGKVARERRVHRVGGGEFVMRWVPAGLFLMGSPASDEEAMNRDRPQREVEIRRGFWMMETPVTQGQYKAIVGENPSYFRRVGLNAPVEQVSWYDAAWFVNKLSALEGLEQSFVGEGKEMRGVGDGAGDYVGSGGWRLPTEAEWEYACRAGSLAPRYGELEEIAWYEYNSNHTTHGVGEKAANGWGLKDMLGNVWEWCYDGYDEDAYQILSGTNASVDPVFTDKRTVRVLRGGSWKYGAGYVRSAYRYRGAPTDRFYDFGFRLLRL